MKSNLLSQTPIIKNQNCCNCFFNFFKKKNLNNLKVSYDLGKLEDSQKKTLILDLDETLVHSNIIPISYYDFKIDVHSNNAIVTFYIQKRPGITEFLETLNEIFELVIFTASVEEYANMVINEIAPFIPISHRFFRKHCVEYGGFYVKDISKFNRSITSMIICDNSPISFILNRKNGIEVKSYLGGKDDDELLSTILPLLKLLNNKNDVDRKSVV